MTVVQRPVVGEPQLFEAWSDGDSLGRVRLAVDGPVARMTTRLASGTFFEDDVAGLVMAVVTLAKNMGVTDVEVDDQSLVVRHVARRLGFGGRLRVPLGARIDDVRAPPARDGDPSAASLADRTAWLVAMLEEMGVTSTAVRPARAWGRLAKRLTGGVGDTLEVAVAWAPERTVLISAPDRVDLMPETVALAADTAVAVLRRFPDQAVGAKVVSFDRAIYELKGSSTYGLTEGSSPSVHLNVWFVALGVALERLAADPPEMPPSGPAVDATVAHELWHRIERVFEARDYRASIEFRRQLGLELGVETLERAIKGVSSRAPASWRAAYGRLGSEVSRYGSTDVREATAEMFTLWWGRGDAMSPMVARFGELVDEFLPPGRGAPPSGP